MFRNHVDFTPAPVHVERFWTRVDKAGPVPTQCPELGPCWIWIGTKGARCGKKRYGKLMINGQLVRTNRAAWVICNGQIPEGLCVLHRCDNPPCVNPSHLFLGTQEENAKDRHSKGRTKEPIQRAKGHSHGMAKLTSGLVESIRKKRKSGIFLEVIAAEFQITVTQVLRICSGKHWKDAGGPLTKPLKSKNGSNNPASKLTEKDVKEIRKKRSNGADMQEIANQFSVSKQVVWSIIHRKTWKHVPD